jgi:hypothetical protein
VKPARRRLRIAAAFGLGCGMAYSSWAFTMGQLDRLDPSGVSGTTAAVVKAGMLGLSIAGLVGALRDDQGDRVEPMTLRL